MKGETPEIIKQAARVFLLIFSLLTILTFGHYDATVKNTPTPEAGPIEIIDLEIHELNGVVMEEDLEDIPELDETVSEDDLEDIPELVTPNATDEEIELIAQLTMAEAEGESEYGQRLVIDTVLNRVDGKYWPDTIREVIYQSNQYSPMWNGRFERCYPREDLVQLVKEELIERTNNEVVFFRTGRYSDYGVPMFKEEHHYFSKYE